MNQPYDISSAMDNPQSRTQEYWGQIAVNGWVCVLEKGIGKTPYNAQVHNPDKRLLNIEFVLVPLPEMQFNKNIERSVIAEFDEYKKLVLPSIMALGIAPSALNGRYVKLTFQPDGRTYADKNSGETRESTTLKFLALFADEAACRADYAQAHGAPVVDSPPWQAPAAPAAATAPANGGNKEKETALKFARVVVKNAVSGQTDLGVIQNTIDVNFGQMPMIGKYLSSGSPEIMTMIMEEMGK